MKRLLLFTGILIVTGNLFGQIRVMPASNMQSSTPGNGIYYALPMTGFKITVQVKKSEKIAGPYSDYAETLLGIRDVIATSSSSYEITDLSLESFVRPDPEQVYFVEYGEEARKDEKTLAMSLSAEGLIVGANNITGAADIREMVLEREEGRGEVPELFKKLAGRNLYEKIDTVVRRINIDTMTIERNFYRSSWEPKSTEQKAKEAVDFMERIRENRFLLISGYQEVNYGESIKYMDDQLNRLYDDYLSLFTGVTLTSNYTYSFIYIPESKREATSGIAFKFSSSRGIAGPEGSYGDNVMINIQPNGLGEAVKDFVDGKQVASPEKRGFYYRIPEYADISIKLGNEVFYQANLLINQLGLIATTPRFEPEVEFHQKTGGLQSIKIK